MSWIVKYQNGALICRPKSGSGQLPVNTAPTASDGAYSVSDQSLTVDAPGLWSLCSDAEGNLFGVELVAAPGQGNVTVNADGSFAYQRGVNTAYTTTFTYRAQDSEGLYSNTATITLTVAAMPVVVVPPSVTAKSYTVPASQAYSVAAPGLLTGATGEGPLTCYKVTDPAHGTVTVNTNGSFVYTPTTSYTGSDSFTFRAYNGTLYSTPATVSITVVAVNATIINDAWLATRTPPFALNTANTTYTFDTDVTVEDTAFVIGAANITLDLNGHTLTYNNRLPIDVVNGRWTSGTIGQAPPNWDVSNISSAVLAANSTSTPAAGCTMQLNVVSTGTQYIESEAVSVNHYPHRIAAMSWVKGSSTSTVITSIVNADTGVILASTTHTAVNRGFAEPVFYNVTAPVNIKVRVRLVTAGSYTVGMVHLAYAQDSCIVTSPSTWYYPIQLANYTNGRYAGPTTLKNGTVIQGRGAGYLSHGVDCTSNSNFTMDSVSMSNNGVNCDAFSGQYSSRDTFTNNTFNATAIPNITNRMHFGTILYLLGGYHTVTDNVLIGCPRMGIKVASGDNIIIQRNTIYPKTLVTEGYGIALSGVQTVDVSNNTISTATSGRGIFIDGLSSDNRPSMNVNIHNNTVSIREVPNFEYSMSGLEATALRVRSYINGYHKNIAVYNNTFEAFTTTGGVGGAIGCRISNTTTDGIATGITFTNNIFKAIVNSGSVDYTAMAFDFADSGFGSDIVLSGNTFESNHISLAFGSNDGGEGRDAVFLSNAIKKSADGVARTYIPIRIGYWIWTPQGIEIYDTTYTGGATESFIYEASDGTVLINYGWLLDVVVTASSVPIVGASVSVSDKDSVIVATGTTGADGRVDDLRITTKLLSGTAPSVPVNTRSPHTLTVRKDGYSQNVQSLTLTGSTTANVAMSI